MNNDLLYIGIIIFIFLIILGLYLSQESSLNISEKNKILTENFSTQVSSTSAQKKGASHLYKWGIPESTPDEPKKCETNPDDIPPFTPKPVEDKCAPGEEISCNTSKNQKCGDCDILSHPDINKYVLKSSVPPCPDSSKFATKNMLQTCPDMSKYILKSKVPKCEKIDKSKYILKSEIPPCPKCPICPTCPVCPTCPPIPECKTINQYKIEEHPDSENYIDKEHIKEYIEKHHLCDLEEEEQISGNTPGFFPSSEENGSNFNPNNIDPNNIDPTNINPNNNNSSNRKNGDRCSYPNMLDRIFAQGSNLKNSNMKGLYAGDNLFARF